MVRCVQILGFHAKVRLLSQSLMDSKVLSIAKINLHASPTVFLTYLSGTN
jgi:hypothetical protein